MGAARRATAIRHLAFEDLGLLGPLLERRGYSLETVEAGIDALDDGRVAEADLVVVLGGPIGVADDAELDRYPFLREELRVVGERVSAGAPTLGVCLGAQVIARALGAEVRATGRKEIGFAPLELTDAGGASPLALLDGTPVLHWHGDEFAVPEASASLAATPGFPNQAFAIGDAVLGLQFHLEVEPARLERWLIGHAVELAAAGIDPRGIRADAARDGMLLGERARLVFDAWLDGAEAA
ncbi:glutamine amidotransferase [Agromyces sp. LHK192]|uniref:glutamine amidotransferase n=1 Tax=Agromyces sp. LHK192 TaxID=2498704 RepID=UPI000FDAFCE0|nr:glutamine amidotransferase [Agromyces sp. LHK192]